MKMEKQLVTGWAGVVVLLTSLRLVGTNPTTYGWFGGLAVLTVVLVAWQITRVLASWRGDNLTVKATWWLVWRHWWRWGLAMAWLTLLTLPFGLWGLSSRLLVRLRLPVTLINFVGLHRHVLGGIAIMGYLVLAIAGGYYLPRFLRRIAPYPLPPCQKGWWRSGWWGIGGGFLGLFTAELLVGVAWWSGSRLPESFSRPMTVGLAFLIWAVLSTVGVWLFIGVLRLAGGQPAAFGSPWRLPDWRLLILLILAGGLNAWQAVNQQPQFMATAIISHRGVDAGHGVQNTLGALRHVSKQRPAYVEMDLHETKDRHWVVLHDENLQQLAQRSVTPHDLTLKQLQRLVVRENGYRDHLVGWETYLRAAEAKHQRLLVEMKTTPQDTPHMIQRFASQYGQRLIHDHDAVHSLDYRVVTRLKQKVPRLPVGYITPFNWVSPRSVPADFYSFQRISLSQEFILAAAQQRINTYVWTPDTSVAMARMWALGTNGQITNEASRLRWVVHQPVATQRWAVLQNFVLSYI
ncbi:glycerophosphodiester phosphodiesterase [Levilactobacillus brevis]|uniref:glycerophosphodiester phosphodiesterase n=1 Tax=Levilactobacillus brevis TaxID=1580 RepID=UPI002073C8CE|nr:glycerophosphodiester phosphodiesterase [Levilactobacillus brevis]MCM6797138.1 glycerophosphodiester phosphodiesterase [Levilactobacillus brevis]